MNLLLGRVALAAAILTASTAAAFATDSPATKRETIHTCLLTIYEGQNSKEAATEYQALLAMKPSDPQMHYRYGLYLERSGDGRAIGEYKKAASLSPGNHDYHHALGNAYLRAKNYSGAAAEYKKSVESGGGAADGALYTQMQQYIQQQQEYVKYKQQLKKQQAAQEDN